MRRDESVALGRRLLNHALGDLSISDISEGNITHVLFRSQTKNSR